MTEQQPSRQQTFDELVRRFASGVRSAQLYSPGHPLVTRNIEALHTALKELLTHQPSITVGFVGPEVVVADTPLPKASSTMGDLVTRFKANRVERIAVDRDVSRQEISDLLRVLATLPARPDLATQAEEVWRSPHIQVGCIKAEESGSGGIASDIAAIRRLYQQAVTIAEDTWETTQVDGMPNPAATAQVVEGLAEAVTQNRTALVALTAMKNYDNYTFTHMVNVSILTMGQARALGIEGRRLREFGLSALMHDIGKVRTPKEILNKANKLTDREFVVMIRHTVDGAEILRRTPEMPILAPVVAFEHHLRLDGAGYPHGVKRDPLNLATMLCSIADVYDAMRSQRSYQQAFPTDRILAVLQRNDGTQFDRHLVRRFAQLMGIYPPGNLVRLSTGEIAVVVKVHAPDPYRPRVRILFDRDGRRLELPVDRSLWQPIDDRGTTHSVLMPVDPADYGIDPLAFL